MTHSFYLEACLSRVINTDSAGKERNRLTKGIILAIRDLAQQSEPGAESRDLAAFIAMALATISETIEVSVAAWEKRDYWVKADKFRMEWTWSGQYAEEMKRAVLTDNWGNVAQISAKIAQKLQKITVPPGNRLGRPWVGAWDELNKK
jgi:leucyl aminopeptidase (aminopeptidase T)